METTANHIGRLPGCGFAGHSHFPRCQFGINIRATIVRAGCRCRDELARIHRAIEPRSFPGHPQPASKGRDLYFGLSATRALVGDLRLHRPAAR